MNTRSYVNYYDMMEDIEKLIFKKWKLDMISSRVGKDCLWKLKTRDQNYKLKLELDNTSEKGVK